MDRRTFLAVAAGSVTAPAFAGQKETVRLVSSMPRVGSAMGQTDHIVNAIRMAIAEWEKQLPFDVKYLDWDDALAATGSWVAELEEANAKKAVADKDVMAYIGTYNSGAAKISMPLLNEAGLVMVSPACTHPGLTRKTKSGDPDEPDRYRPAKVINFCRVCPHDDTQGPLAAKFVATELKAKSVYVLDDKELYGAGIAESFAAECKALGIKILGRESIDVLARDYAALMAKVKKAEPDAVYFGGTTQSKGGQIAKDFVASGMKCPLVVPDGCYELAFIESAGKQNLKNCYVTMGGIVPGALKGPGAEFAKRYKEKFGNEPEAYAVYGYEAAAVVLEAIRKVGKKDRDAIRKAVLATKDFDKGALGKWSFDENGDTTLQQLTVSKIENGKFVPVKVLEAGK
jgi:branched-chain amino acid transport system substrate-binding protein